MTFEFAHNFLRKLMNLEGGQLSFLTEVQQDNFYANPHTFFIRADDETARQIWDVLYPKAPEPIGEKRGNVIYPRDWLTKERTDYEYDTVRVVPHLGGTSAPSVPRTFIMNDAPVSALAG